MKVAFYIEQGKIDTFELDQQECQASRSSVLIFASPRHVLSTGEIRKKLNFFLVEEEEDTGDPGGEKGLREVKSTMWMIMTCSQTGSVAAAKEVVTFCQHLGHREVAFYGGNEPTIRSDESF